MEDLATAYSNALKMQLGFIEQHHIPNEKGDIPNRQVTIVQQRIPPPDILMRAPQPPAGRVNHGCCSDILSLHAVSFGKSVIHFNGSTLHHGERKGSAIEFGSGTVVRVEHLRDFGITHALLGAVPDFKKPVLKRKI